MPLCEILWNWRPVSVHHNHANVLTNFTVLCVKICCVVRASLSSAWIKVEQLKPYHPHKEEMIKINKGKRFQQAVDAVEDYLKKAKGKEQVIRGCGVLSDTYITHLINSLWWIGVVWKVCISSSSNKNKLQQLHMFHAGLMHWLLGQ